MKKHLFSIAFLTLLFSQTSFSQVTESDEQMAAGTFNALSIALEITDTKLADKVWKNFVKNYGGKVKKVKGGSETLTADAEIIGINGVTPMNIYAKITGGSGSPVELTVWFDLGDGYLSSSQTEKYAEAERFLKKYELETRIESTNIELDDTEKKLRSVESELEKLKRQNSGLHKDIENYEKKIQQAKDDIVKNESQQTEAGTKIELQKEITEEINNRLRELKKN